MTSINNFTLIRKGLCALLYHTTLTLQQTDFTNTEEGVITLEKTMLAKKLFEQSGKIYDSLTLSVIYRHEPSEATEFEENKLKLRQLMKTLSDLCLTYHNMLEPEEKIEIGNLITCTFSKFMMACVEFIAARESILMRILFDYYTEEQIKLLEKKIIESIPNADLLISTLWIIRGNNNNEIINWFESIKNVIPPASLNYLINITESELPGYRWEKIREKLTEGVMMEQN